MTETPGEIIDPVEIVAYNPRWPDAYAAERDLVLSVGGGGSSRLSTSAAPPSRGRAPSPSST